MNDILPDLRHVCCGYGFFSGKVISNACTATDAESNSTGKHCVIFSCAMVWQASVISSPTLLTWTSPRKFQRSLSADIAATGQPAILQLAASPVHGSQSVVGQNVASSATSSEADKNLVSCPASRSTVVRTHHALSQPLRVSFAMYELRKGRP